MGIVSQRRRKQRAERMRRRMLIAAALLLLGSLAMSPQLRERMDTIAQDVQVFGDSAQAELTFPEREIYALQLGVYDNGERAAGEAQRLMSEGVLCIVWQKEKMRIVADAALSRNALDMNAAKGHDAYVISDRLEAVSLRLTADAAQIADAQQLLQTPDDVFLDLQDGESLETILADVRSRAQRGQTAHPENALYTQLAQSLENWCDLIEKTMDQTDESSVRSYAQVTICTLCRELRQALENQAVSEASTASAQRTPSTAADVMPPA